MSLRMMRGLAMNSGSARAFKHTKTKSDERPIIATDQATGNITVTPHLQECVRHGKFQPHWKTCHYCLSEN